MFANNVPNKLSIQEANKHIRLMSERIEHLESELAKQASEHTMRDQEREIHYQELLKIKDAESAHYRQMNEFYEIQLNHLTDQVETQQQFITALQDKSRVLDELLSTKPVLESMVKLMSVYESLDEDNNSLKTHSTKTMHSSPTRPTKTVKVKASTSVSDNNLNYKKVEKELGVKGKSHSTNDVSSVTKTMTNNPTSIPNGDINHTAEGAASSKDKGKKSDDVQYKIVAL